MPGLIVDRYEDVLVAQVGTYGMELRKEMLFPLILDVLRSDGQKIRGIYERADSPARRLEGLDLHKGWWKEPDVLSLTAPASWHRRTAFSSTWT
jgi:23S rRNA (cytosine1962-C5)-methyltransferase